MIWEDKPTEHILDLLPTSVRTGNRGHHTSADLIIKHYSDGWYIVYESFCCGGSDDFLSERRSTLRAAAIAMYEELDRQKLL